jgi:GT2 family glycosyltransferase/SAM-dependent methyltransferase
MNGRTTAEIEEHASHQRAVERNMSVVVVTRNEGPRLRATVDALLSTLEGETDVIVVDDCSTDGSTAFLDSAREIRLLRATERFGVANARNFGAAAAQGDVIVFSDAHVAPQPGWAAPLFAALDNPTAGAVSPVMAQWVNPMTRVQGLRFVDAALNVDWIPVHATEPTPVPLLCGCFMALRRDVFEAVGGFDPGMAYYGSEDLELCLRLWRMGYECLVVPESEIAHRFRVPQHGDVDWENFLHNLLRMATVHLDPDDLGVVVTNLRRHPEFPAAASRVLAGDVGERRARIAASSRFDTRWFLERFSMDVFAKAPARNGRPRRGDYRAVNRRAWSYWAGAGSPSSQPVGDADFASAREWIDPRGWIDWDDVKTVLCLASAGGQQAPLFASLGCKVTLVDLSPEQLAIDERVAAERGLEIELIEGDMLDLSQLAGRSYDLVYQPISACYIPYVRPLYRQVHDLLRPGGLYDVEHWNPTSMQLWQLGRWDGRAYRLVHPQRSGVPVRWNFDAAVGADGPVYSLHYIHPLEKLLGVLCETGFVIERFGERTNGDPRAQPGSEEHLAAYAPPYFRLLARRTSAA